SLEDVMTLPGAQRAMRSLREIQVHAGLGIASSGEGPPASGEAPRAAAARDTTSRTAGGRAGGESPTGPAIAEAQTLAQILGDGRSARAADGKRLTALARLIATRSGS